MTGGDHSERVTCPRCGKTYLNVNRPQHLRTDCQSGESGQQTAVDEWGADA